MPLPGLGGPCGIRALERNSYRVLSAARKPSCHAFGSCLSTMCFHATPRDDSSFLGSELKASAPSFWSAYLRARCETEDQRFQRHRSCPSSRPLHPKHYYLFGRPRHRLRVRDECSGGPFGLWLTPAWRHAVKDMNQKWCPGERAEESAHFICPEVAAEDHKQHNKQAEHQTRILESFHLHAPFRRPFHNRDLSNRHRIHASRRFAGRHRSASIGLLRRLRSRQIVLMRASHTGRSTHGGF